MEWRVTHLLHLSSSTMISACLLPVQSTKMVHRATTRVRALCRDSHLTHSHSHQCCTLPPPLVSSPTIPMLADPSPQNWRPSSSPLPNLGSAETNAAPTAHTQFRCRLLHPGFSQPEARSSQVLAAGRPTGGQLGWTVAGSPASQSLPLLTLMSKF